MSEARRNAPLLEIRDLSVTFAGRGGSKSVEAVRGVSLTLDRSETVALVGESGSGKSVTALSILQLLPYPLATHGADSSIRLAGEELVGAAPDALRRVRGNRIAMVFQEPMTSLDFLGFGLPPGSPSLGEILAQGKANLQAPWLGLTAFFVLASMLSLLIFVGEAVRDAFDPRKVVL